MTWLTDPHAWIAFTTLLALELVLGIDNVVFISILAGKLRTGHDRVGEDLVHHHRSGAGFLRQ
jgi:predicted tellurium resistance membrane protein TerC